MSEYREHPEVPVSKMTKCKVSHITDNTGFGGPSDMDNTYHKGFTVGGGKKMYWEIVWHSSGHCTVYHDIGRSGRYLNGDTEITIHFK